MEEPTMTIATDPSTHSFLDRSSTTIGHAAGMNTSQEQRLNMQIDPAYYRSGEHSDIVVCYGSGADARERLLHKIVLCSQSEFFKLMLAAPMKESRESVVHLHEDPELVDSALDFMYLGALTYELPDHASPADAAIRILGIYEIANQYMIDALLNATAIRFSDHLKHNPSLSANVAVLRTAYLDLTRDTHDLRKLIARAYNIWAPSISLEMEEFLLENKDAIGQCDSHELTESMLICFQPITSSKWPMSAWSSVLAVSVGTAIIKSTSVSHQLI
ncbi:hypothetical protein SLS55_007338 [Diplodia seriata]|uniref:BTB domain-containing protein n=1 Tax=Diplodia seriata TaxID=420778 RepID=A0ABR3CD17_9PEZI